jgi:hypothetical protein
MCYRARSASGSFSVYARFARHFDHYAALEELPRFIAPMLAIAGSLRPLPRSLRLGALAWWDHSSAIMATSSLLTTVAGVNPARRSARRARPFSCSFSQVCTSWTLTRPRPTG